MSESTPKKATEEGIGSMKLSPQFRMSNFELFTKPNKLIMAFGLTCFGLSLFYIANMGTTTPESGAYDDYEGTFGNEQLIEKLIKEKKPKPIGDQD